MYIVLKKNYFFYFHVKTLVYTCGIAFCIFQKIYFMRGKSWVLWLFWCEDFHQRWNFRREKGVWNICGKCNFWNLHATFFSKRQTTLDTCFDGFSSPDLSQTFRDTRRRVVLNTPKRIMSIGIEFRIVKKKKIGKNCVSFSFFLSFNCFKTSVYCPCSSPSSPALRPSSCPSSTYPCETPVNRQVVTSWSDQCGSRASNPYVDLRCVSPKVIMGDIQEREQSPATMITQRNNKNQKQQTKNRKRTSVPDVSQTFPCTQ